MRIVAATAVAAVLVLAACGDGGSTTSAQASITPPLAVAAVGSPVEQAVAHAYAAGLESAGFEVEVTTRYTTLRDVAPALRVGDADLAPAPLGEALAVLTDVPPPSDPQQAFTTLQGELSGQGIVVLDFSPGQRSGQFVVTQQLAEQLGVSKLSQLATAPLPLTLAGPATCEQRRDCAIGLRTTYGLSTLEFLETDDGGPETLAALADRRANIALLHTTDAAAIEEQRLVVLEDDMGIAGPGNLAPLASEAIVSEALTDALVDVSVGLDGGALTELEERVESGEAPEDAARAVLGS